MGTPFQPDTTNAIFFLEDVHEEPYRIDRMLTTLSLGGLFDKVAGILFGRCSDCGVKGPSFSLEEILRDRFGTLPVPALSFGHIEQKLVFPIAARATPTRMRGGAGGGGGGGVGDARDSLPRNFRKSGKDYFVLLNGSKLAATLSGNNLVVDNQRTLAIDRSSGTMVFLGEDYVPMDGRQFLGTWAYGNRDDLSLTGIGWSRCGVRSGSFSFFASQPSGPPGPGRGRRVVRRGGRP
jgi:hypothetical protein